jgi:hypothetical protein
MLIFLVIGAVLAIIAVRIAAFFVSMLVYGLALGAFGFAIYYYIRHAAPRWPGRK